ncbi:hypothetical protein JTE90_021312 [Oedothorax gibbosus]|uniref:Uncharacterized protein n=1 Tax=Oedothorax gibbosus TaxID=931172 RepID=A0AAV6VP27_9ARAC|nr:hypothetical protein JTE90_021312 [Oedothorax gibbosus]
MNSSYSFVKDPTPSLLGQQVPGHCMDTSPEAFAQLVAVLLSDFTPRRALWKHCWIAYLNYGSSGAGGNG